LRKSANFSQFSFFLKRRERKILNFEILFFLPEMKYTFEISLFDFLLYFKLVLKMVRNKSLEKLVFQFSNPSSEDPFLNFEQMNETFCN